MCAKTARLVELDMFCAGAYKQSLNEAHKLNMAKAARLHEGIDSCHVSLYGSMHAIARGSYRLVARLASITSVRLARVVGNSYAVDL